MVSWAFQIPERRKTDGEPKKPTCRIYCFYKVQILTVDAAVHAENLAYNYSSLAPLFDFLDQNLSLCV